MIHYMPIAIMFAATILFCALFFAPIKIWTPADRTVRFYWRGVWLFLVAITSIAGAMNTLLLAGVDVVEPTEFALRIILAAFVGFVMVGWFQLVGLGAFRVARRVARAG